MNALATMNWTRELKGTRIIRPEIIETTHVSGNENRVEYSFNLSSVNAHIPSDSYNWIICGLRIIPAEGMLPPGGEPLDAHEVPFSVFLRRNKHHGLFGIPGDFTMAYYGRWDTFTWPIPIGVIRALNPSVHLYYPGNYIGPLVVELYLRQIEDISDYNYVFVISNSSVNDDPVRAVAIYQKRTGLFPMEHFIGDSSDPVPGPFKIIPSWGLIRRGWFYNDNFYNTMDVNVLRQTINHIWNSTLLLGGGGGAEAVAAAAAV